MTIAEAREIAARCWCDKSTSDREMDVTLAEQVALAIKTAHDAAYVQGWDACEKVIAEQAGA